MENKQVLDTYKELVLETLPEEVATMIDKKNNVCNVNKGLVAAAGSDLLPTNKLTSMNELKKWIEIHNLLLVESYRDIFYSLFEKKFIYIKDLEKIKNTNWTRLVHNLINYKLIEQIEITDNIKSYLKEKSGMGEYHIDKIKFYGFSLKGYLIMQSKKELIYNNVSEKILKKIEMDIYDFVKVLDNIKKKSADMEQWRARRYQILRQSNRRTIQQDLFIQEYELDMMKNEKR